jgi:methylglutaconyl-CoA hydratase
MSHGVLLEQNGPIATLTLNRPDIHNALDDALIAELNQHLKSLDKQPDNRLLIVRANGKSFSAGADLNWMRRMAQASEDENYQDSMALSQLMQGLYEFSKPTIAVVQGAAFGGGVGLLACADIVIAAKQAQFALPEVKLGLIPAVISPYVVSAMGVRAARYYFLTGERFDATKARELNLVHQVVALEELDQTAANLSNKILANGPQALTECKKLLNTVEHQTLNDDLRKTLAHWIARVRVGEEGQAGMNAFLDKHNPPWLDTKGTDHV